MRTSSVHLIALALVAGCSSGTPRAVLYCAQDQPFAEALLRDFTRESGVEPAVKYDTEADKSVSLYLLLVRERNRPRCDVFWNNEILSTLRLQKLGLLEPHDSPSARTLPADAKAADHTWHAFAARARVLIVNTRLVKPGDEPKSLLDLTDPRWKDRVVMAKPQAGTSATQVACLFAVLGPEKAKDWYRGLKANGVQVAPGNKQVAEWVGRGRTPGGQAVAVGITDTDDAILEVEAGSPVAIVFPDRDRPADDAMGTLFIPNTVALLKGGPNPDAGRELIDFLLRPETEARLATGGGRQFPLHPGVEARMPEALEAGRSAKQMKVDFARAAEMWEETQDFLRKEFAQ